VFADGSPAAAKFNNADVTFATEMIPHHQHVEMAELAADRAQSPEAQQLAENIERAQGPEIETIDPVAEELRPGNALGFDGPRRHGTR